MTRRLSTAVLASTAAETPTYDRAASRAGIVHVGLGAFARAHVARYCDDLLAEGHDDVAVAGISLRSGAVTNALAPQDGLYTLTETDGRRSHDRIIGAVTTLGHGAASAIDAIAAPTARAVTLTITEKGYLRGLGGGIDLDEAAVRADLAHPATPTTAPGVLVAGLRRRRDGGLGPIPIVSCDNLDDNGATTAAVVVSLAAALDAELATWIESHVPFPSSVVDRIVPATTNADRIAVEGRLGYRDAAPVRCEPHCRWVIGHCDTLPPWDSVGATVTDDVTPWQRHKLWAVNGPHSALAYLGGLAGHETIDAAATDPDLSEFVIALIGKDVVPLLVHGADGSSAASTVERFANPVLGHRCTQVAADGSRKLSQRVLDVMVRRRAAGLDIERHALVMAAWAAWIIDAAGGRRRLVDPDDESLVQAVRTTTDRRGRVAALLSNPSLAVSGAVDDPDVVGAVERCLGLIDGIGPTAAARRLR